MQPYHLQLHLPHGSQMYNDLVRRADDAFSEQDRRKKAFTSVAEFEAHREQVRAHFMDAIGGLPSEKCPLNAQVTGAIAGDEFTIEKVLFQSLPGYVVSSACYIPHGVSTNAPAVLFVCGHSAQGKAAVAYQRVCRDLASNGFVVLAIDPVGQGERLQYLKDDVDAMGSCTTEHTHIGFQFLLQGASVARHFIWDIIRAVDYLCERPEVDVARIGITGNSGGGTQTSYAMLCEPRLAAAVPCTFVTSLEEIMQSGAPQDMEQIVYGAMVRGPEHDDFLTAIAPRPVLLGVVDYDFFPIEGSLQTYARAKEIYQLYDQPDNVGVARDASKHCYSDGLRQAAVNWFKKHLKNEEPDFITQNPDVLPPEQLNATPSGNILRDYPQSRTAFDLNVERLEQMPKATDVSAADLRRKLSQTLGVDQAGSRKADIYPRILPGEHDGYNIERIWFFSAPRVITGGVLFYPKAASKVLSTTLLVLENGSSDLPQRMNLVEQLLAQGKAVFVMDPRGIGSLKAFAVDCHEDHPVFHGEYVMGSDAIMLGISTMGLRIFDILRTFDYLHSREDLGAIEIYGVGHGANWAYFAAAIEENISAVSCEDMLLSYKQLCKTRFYNHERYHLNVMAWGLLRCGDVGDFKKCIAPRPLQIIAPREDLEA